jgi:hypothetical protein
VLRERMLASLGPDAAANPFQGLCISRDDVAGLLDPWPGGAAWSAQSPLANDLTEADRGEDGSQHVGPEQGWLTGACGLSDFDLNVVLPALAPKIDLRYERVHVCLQDNVSRRRPTVDLALNLVCATPEGKLRRCRHFTADSPVYPPRRRATGARTGQHPSHLCRRMRKSISGITVKNPQNRPERSGLDKIGRHSCYSWVLLQAPHTSHRPLWHL